MPQPPAPTPAPSPAGSRNLIAAARAPAISRRRNCPRPSAPPSPTANFPSHPTPDFFSSASTPELLHKPPCLMQSKPLTSPSTNLLWHHLHRAHPSSLLL